MILKAMFWQLMDRDNRIRIPHPLPKRKATPYGVAFLLASGFGMGFEPIRYNALVERCLPPARWRNHHNFIESLIIVYIVKGHPIGWPFVWYESEGRFPDDQLCIQQNMPLGQGRIGDGFHQNGASLLA